MNSLVAKLVLNSYNGAMTQLTMRFFGTFQVSWGEKEITRFRSTNVQALLLYLVLHADRPLSREFLAALLWPDEADKVASTNFRQALYQLRKLLPDKQLPQPIFHVTRQTVQFNTAADYRCDVHQFQQALREEAWQTAADCYTGALTPNLTIDSLEFDEWLLAERATLRQQALDGLLALGKAQLIQHDPTAQQTARRLLTLEPWLEEGHQLLIRALAADGKHAEALNQYEQCRTILRDELGLEPSAETQRLLAEISAALPTVTNLPWADSPLIGREEERETVQKLVTSQRLVTIVGQGGIGKSTLSLTIGRELLSEFGGGVWLVPLVGIAAGQVDALYTAIGNVLNIRFDGRTPLPEQLKNALAQRHLLLILDNFEHLAATAADDLLFLLEAAPKLHLLVTSRIRLNLAGEQLVRLHRLSVEAAEALFVNRAQKLVPTFAFRDEARTDFEKIYELVAGLPLGLELAATWVEHFTCAEIAANIAQSGRAVSRQTETADERHDSLQAVYEHSWQLLDLAEQQALAQLSLFRGAFSREAVLAITAATLSNLSALLGKSLLRRASGGRYELHEVIREFSDDKLTQLSEPFQRAETEKLYRHYYLDEPFLEQERSVLREELSNIRAAWRLALAQKDRPLVERGVRPLANLLHGLGLLQEGLSTVEPAVELGEGEGEAAARLAITRFMQPIEGLEKTLHNVQQALTLTQDPTMRVHLHSFAARQLAETGRWELAEVHYLLQAQAAEASGDLATYIHALVDHAEDQVLQFVGDYRQAIGRLERAYKLAVEENVSPELRLKTLEGLNTGNMRYGRYDRALTYVQEGLALSQQIGNRIGEVDARLGLGIISAFAGLYAASVDHSQLGLVIAEEVGDREGVGILEANLSLAYRQLGELEKALKLGEAGAAILDDVGNTRLYGLACNRIGHTHIALLEWERAEQVFTKIIKVWDRLDKPNRYEALAGRGLALHHLGRLAEGVALVEEVLVFAEQEHAALRVVEPILMLLYCEEVLRAADQPDRAAAVLIQAKRWIDTIANRNKDEMVRQAYLHNVPAHQLLYARLEG